MNAAEERALGEPVVVGVDGSRPSLRAVDWAADEAVLRGAPLKAVYACPWKRYEGAALARDIGRPTALPLPQDVVGAAADRARARHPGLRVSATVVFEEPEYALVREARHACALVVGIRGRSRIAELLLGSVGLAVAAHADCPVIVLRGGRDDRAPRAVRGRVVVGVGSHVEGSAAVRFAAEEARRRGVPLEAVRAWLRPAHESTGHPPPAGEPARPHEERAAEELRAALQDAPPDADVHPHTVEGHARRVLADASRGADLLVVGADRRDGHAGLRPGRLSQAVLQHSACPVAIVPDRGRRA